MRGFHLLAYAALASCIAAAPLPLAQAMPALSPEGSQEELIAQSTDQLTEETIQSLLEEMRTARLNNDVDSAMAFVAPFAVSVVTVRSGSISTTVDLAGADDHRQLLERSFGRVESRELLQRDVSIDIITDEFGTATIYLLENLQTMEGKTFISYSETVLVLGWVDDRPMITSMTLDGWIAERPSEE